MGALRSIDGTSSSPELQQERTIDKIDKVEDEDDGIDSSPEHEKIITKEKVDKVNENHNDRVSISISRKAYDTLEKYTKELNEGEYGSQKPFTIEEVLEQEITLLLSDEWKKD
jgi:hypothetical protein